jgi:GNAT superfamily N-acetyltransferase
VQKAVRRAGRRLVAVTCHYDVTDWLQPDWVFDVAAGSFEWRSVQPRPALELHIHPGGRELWPVFRRHHYLSADLHPTARCHLALVEGRPVAFTSYLHFPHPTVRNLKMAHRIVVLPDWQGLGIAGRVSEWLGEHLYGQGMRYRIATAHPGLVAYMASSPRWRSVGRPRGVRSGRTAKKRTAQQTDPRSLLVRSFEYAPQPSTPAQPAGGRKRPS